MRYTVLVFWVRLGQRGSCDRRPTVHRGPIPSKAFDYWQSERRDRFAPSRADIEPEELTLILPFVYLVDVIGSPPRFRYRLAGTGIVKEYGAEITGKFADEIDINENQTAFLIGYKRVASEGKPISNRGKYVRRGGAK